MAGTMEQDTRRPGVALVAAVLVGLQGLVVLAGGVWLGAETFLTTDAKPLGIGLGVMALVIGGVLIACAIGVHRGQSWSRGPVVTWQLITAFIAMRLAAGGLWAFAAPLLVLAVGIAVLLAGPWVIRRRDPLA